MKIFISAGEASGDALGAALLGALKRKLPKEELKACGMGGALMQAEGFEALEPAEALSVVGLIEVIKHLPRLFALLDSLAERAIAFAPDVAVLIDSPDFNVRLAKRLRAHNIPVACYVGPSVWAWRAGRVKTFKRAFDKMMVLFPFETPIWERAKMDVVCVGHPLIDQVEKAALLSAQSKTVALLPGSRRSEINRHLQTMLKVVARLKREGLAQRFVLPVAPTLKRAELSARIEQSEAAGMVELIDGGEAKARWAAIADSALALVVSGTATLETALVGRPQVIFYKVNPLSFLIGRMLMKVKHFGLPNIIAGREVAPELLQGGFHEDALFEHAARLLSDEEARGRALQATEEVRERLGETGAAERAAEAVLAMLKALNK